MPQDQSNLTDRIEAELRKVRDPNLDIDVFDAGIVENIDVEDGNVTVEADLSDFQPQESDALISTVLRAVSTVDGVESAHVEHAAPSTEGRSSGVADVDTIIAVASAKGGVGKSTVAVNLACALAETQNVGLFDADIHGPNVPSFLDVSGPVYSDDDGNPLPIAADGLEVMSVGLMEEGAPLAWRGAMAHDALTELFEETAWKDRDTLVIDLPPGTGDIVLTTLQEVPVDGVVFVTTPFHAAVTDTERSIALFQENDVPVLGTVVNMETFTCPSCGDEHSLFPDQSPLDSLDTPVLTRLPFSSDLQSTPKPGAVGDEMRSLGDRVESRLDEIWNVSIPDDAVDLRDVPPNERHERVETAFTERQPGEEFVLVSDRDPAPVRSYLAELAEVSDPREAFETFEVARPNPKTWILRTQYPTNR
ncbi:P-loop NTPase [Haladaptatus sp. NG-SE-30]